MPNPDSLLYQVSSQTSVPPPLAALLQQNPSFQTFLNENPQINQLLLSNPELVNQFQINPNLLKETQEHAKFLNTFLQENANLPQIIKDNPNVYGFILKQVDQAVKTGQDKTIVIQMTEADIKEAQKELQEAQQSIKAQSQSQNINSGLTSVNGSTTGTNAFTGFSREELLAILAKYQAAQQSLLAVSQTLPAIGNENNIVYQTSLPKQQLNPNSALVTSWNSLSRPNGGSIHRRSSDELDQNFKWCITRHCHRNERWIKWINHEFWQHWSQQFWRLDQGQSSVHCDVQYRAEKHHGFGRLLQYRPSETERQDSKANCRFPWQIQNLRGPKQRISELKLPVRLKWDFWE